MICPAILDPFQGANYRLVAATHQALLCPIIAKLFGYVFTPLSNTPPKYDVTTHESSSHVQSVSHSQLCDIDKEFSNIHNTINTQLYNECNQSVNGKQMENGCDVGNNVNDSKLCPNDSNKKIQ